MKSYNELFESLKSLSEKIDLLSKEVAELRHSNLEREKNEQEILKEMNNDDLKIIQPLKPMNNDDLKIIQDYCDEDDDDASSVDSFNDVAEFIQVLKDSLYPQNNKKPFNETLYDFYDKRREFVNGHTSIKDKEKERKDRNAKIDIILGVLKGIDWEKFASRNYKFGWDIIDKPKTEQETDVDETTEFYKKLSMRIDELSAQDPASLYQLARYIRQQTMWNCGREDLTTDETEGPSNAPRADTLKPEVKQPEIKQPEVKQPEVDYRGYAPGEIDSIFYAPGGTIDYPFNGGRRLFYPPEFNHPYNRGTNNPAIRGPSYLDYAHRPDPYMPIFGPVRERIPPETPYRMFENDLRNKYQPKPFGGF